MQTDIIKSIKAIGVKPTYDISVFKNRNFVSANGLIIHNPGSKLEKSLLKNIEMTVRAHRLSFFFIAPSFVQHNFHYFLETWQIMGKKKLNPDIPVEKQWVATKSLVYDHREHALGYVLTDSPKNADFLRKYEKKKDEFIVEIRKRRGIKRPFYLLEIAASLVQKKDFIEKWVNPTASADAKSSLIMQYTEGEQFTISDLKTMKSHIEYIVAYDPKLQGMRELKEMLRVQQKVDRKELQKELKKARR